MRDEGGVVEWWSGGVVEGGGWRDEVERGRDGRIGRMNRMRGWVVGS